MNATKIHTTKITGNPEVGQCAWLNTEVCNRNFPGQCEDHPRPAESFELVDLQAALQGEYLARITDPWQRNRVARGVRRNDLMALRFAFPAS